MELPTDLPVWKTVRLGMYKTTQEYRLALEGKYFPTKFYDECYDILDRICVSQEEIEVDLVKVSVYEILKWPSVQKFGSNSMHYHAVCNAVRRVGLVQCPAEVGPALCLQWEESLEKGREVHVDVGAQPIRIRHRDANFFRVGRKPWKSCAEMDTVGYCRAGGMDDQCSGNLVFMKPRK